MTIRVVIVDDQEDIRVLVRAILDLVDDIAVTGEADSAAEALAVFESGVPDVAILDYMMPGTNGLDLAAAIHGTWPDVRVIMFSAFADELPRDAFGVAAVCDKADAWSLPELVRHIATARAT